MNKNIFDSGSHSDQRNYEKKKCPAARQISFFENAARFLLWCNIYGAAQLIHAPLSSTVTSCVYPVNKTTSVRSSYMLPGLMVPDNLYSIFKNAMPSPLHPPHKMDVHIRPQLCCTLNPTKWCQLVRIGNPCNRVVCRFTGDYEIMLRSV